jgi:hypothetical protein
VTLASENVPNSKRTQDKRGRICLENKIRRPLQHQTETTSLKFESTIPSTTMGDKGDGGDTLTEVYVLDKEFAWVPARLMLQEKDTAKVSIPQYPEEALILNDGGKGASGWREETVKLKNYPGGQLPLANMAGTELNVKEDMCDLPFLHEVRTHRSARVIMVPVSCGPLTLFPARNRLLFSTTSKRVIRRHSLTLEQVILSSLSTPTSG